MRNLKPEKGGPHGTWWLCAELVRGKGPLQALWLRHGWEWGGDRGVRGLCRACCLQTLAQLFEIQAGCHLIGCLLSGCCEVDARHGHWAPNSLINLRVARPKSWPSANPNLPLSEAVAWGVRLPFSKTAAICFVTPAFLFSVVATSIWWLPLGKPWSASNANKPASSWLPKQDPKNQ